MATEGVFTPQGEFLPLPKPANSILKDIEERFRRLLLKRLHRAERLSEEFMNRLLQWNPSSRALFGLCGAARLGRRAAADGKTRQLHHPRSPSS